MSRRNWSEKTWAPFSVFICIRSNPGRIVYTSRENKKGCVSIERSVSLDSVMTWDPNNSAVEHLFTNEHNILHKCRSTCILAAVILAHAIIDHWT